jgi:hypothetical protein
MHQTAHDFRITLTLRERINTENEAQQEKII